MAATSISEDRLQSGHRLSHPPPGDEVLITGVSGYFPDSDSVIHLQENLFNKVDLVSNDARRWKLVHSEIPHRTGKINNLNKFDASFFGMNPKELRGTKVGVFIGTCFSESEKTWFYEKMQINRYGISGLGLLSPDGACKSFDNSANGYVRSEAIVIIFLQKAKDSRRVYARVVHGNTNCDGYKEHGTKVGDPQELQAIDEIFCAGRRDPLLIGSIKSNLGHTEPASGLCSIAKMCIAYNTGYIPPNIHFQTPREGVAALAEKRLAVVTDKTAWGRGMSGVNSFGFGGANAHVLLKDVAREKVNHGLPSDNLPRLACVSGRTKSAVARILDDLESRIVDVDHIRLLHAIHDKDIAGHDFRGYTVLGSTSTKSVSLAREIQYFSRVRRPVWFVYSGMGSQWAGMAKELIKIPVFASAIKKCHKALEPKGINLTKIITENDPKIYDNILNSFIGIAAVQIGLTDVLKTIGIEPDYIIGYSVGDFSCAYADGCLTAEETILSTYNEGLALKKKTLIKYSMADIDIGYHQQVVKNFKRTRSQKWVSTPLLNSQYRSTKLSSKSHKDGVKQILVLFEETSRLIHSNAIIIEIAPHGVLQAILRRSLKKDVINIALTQKDHPNNAQVLFTAIGKLYKSGLNPHLANIYPHVPFPVSQGTPMLAHLVEWDHSENWFVTSFKDVDKMEIGERTVLMSKNDESEYMTGYVINGCNLYPVTGYLFLVWETLGMMMGEPHTEVSVVFENVRFQRATNIPKESSLEFAITIHKKSGNFEILECGASIVTGRIYAKKNVGQNFRVLPNLPEVTGPSIKHLLTKDFYKELRLRGYQYSGLFRGVIGCNVQYTRGRLSWVNNWVTFLDCMLQMKIIGQDTRGIFVPTRIEKLSIDAAMHYNATSKMNCHSHIKSFEVRVYPDVNVIRAGGVEIQGLHTTSVIKRQPLEVPVYEKHEFIPNFGKSKKIEDILRTNVQLVFENIQTHKVKTIELVDEEYKKNGLQPILENVGKILADLPFALGDLLMISKDPFKVSSNITVENRKLIGESNAVLFIGANLLGRPRVFQQAVDTLCDKAFIMSREKEQPNLKKYSDKFDVVTFNDTGFEYLVLLRKRVGARPAKFVRVLAADNTFSWVNRIKKELKQGQKLVLYAQDEHINGLLGLVNCLRKEPGGEIVHGLFISDPSAPSFNPYLEFYEEQLNKDLIFNVYKDGQWGTYRHLLLKDLDTVRANHAYVNALTIGDLSSLKWVEGTIRENHVYKDKEKVLVHIMLGKMKPGESILIHDGSGGVGQAAINVALHYGCEVFTTVSTVEKRAFIKKLFPQLKDSHIGNSRDTSFEDMIRRETNGKGVNIVLNSLSGDKLQASVRCLAFRGHFLEIGKFDINNNTAIAMYFISKEITFRGITLNHIFNQDVMIRKRLQELLLSGINDGAVKPLTYCTFKANEVEHAFRYMAAGKHIGKVIVKIREEEPSSHSIRPVPKPFDAMPRYICHEDHVYVVVGGLGGFGLELADWLIMRGGRKILLTSRRGITNGYQSSRLRAWASYGAEVQFSTHDVSTESGCERMLLKALNMGPVHAIFNLAVILRDSIFENQTSEAFKTSFAPKALATMNLDKLSRKLCPELKDFVVFSSMSCGRGNAGQTNYGYSNSVMERICEERKKVGLPAMTIQWGAVADVGLVADTQEDDVQLEIGGTLQQRISSCLTSLDKLMKQSAPVVSCIVVADKKAGSVECANAIDAVAQIMGIKNLKSVSQQTSLAEMGMDSMIALEIKKTLETDFEIFLRVCDIKSLTFTRLEKEGFKGTVFCLDGAPDFLNALLTMTISFKNDFQLQNNLLCHTVDIVAPNNDVTKGLMEKLNEIESYDERVALTIKTSPVQSKYSAKFIANIASASFDRLKTILDFDPKAFRKLQSPIILLRPKENPSFVAVEENYGLDKYTENNVTVHFLEGNHVSIIENKDCANIINRVLVQNGPSIKKK
ncbi:unnamed protein product [Spodoptera littoralis]|uniref:Uncharacterized protein n=1 Tax=Spodoptera littoralis TaxID=7109 RepID=A0A9P0I475_SPOLI|nr:unnamed protein product [Spodoptera littoralis]CAH1641072.1 unnamed protein product [Spodoptera littoralis]